MIVDVDGLSDAIGQTLNEYNKDIIDAVKKEADSSMKQLVKETKATAPVGHRRSKHYKNSITSKIDRENALSVEHVWYVKGSDYRLSHLLENGHATRNGGGKGFVSGTHFIKNASDPIIQKYIKKVEEVLKRG